MVDQGWVWNPTQATRRLTNVIGDRSMAVSIVKKVDKIFKNAGFDYTLDYLKCAREHIKRFQMRNPHVVSGEPWVSRINNFPELYYQVWLTFGLEKALMVSNWYKWFQRNTPDQQSVDKEVTAVHETYAGTTRLDVFCQGFQSWCNSFLLSKFHHNLPDFRPKFTQNIGKIFSNSIGVGRPPIMNSFHVLASLWNDLKDLGDDCGWPDIFSPLKDYRVRSLVEEGSKFNIELTGGYVNASLEQGGKFRLFASPHKVLQCLTHPLLDFLAMIRDSLGTDCTLDQDSGALAAMSVLASGRTVYSIDQSSATHRFPLPVQTCVLHALAVPAPWIRLINKVLSAPYLVSGPFKDDINASLLRWGYQPDRFVWKNGQPLGIKPSIALYGLTHNLICFYLCEQLDLDPLESFRILGDDIVIFNSFLAEAYKQLMGSLGCVINVSKTYTSNRYAEFAGYSITPSFAIRPGTYPLKTKLNFLDLSLKYGSDLGCESSWYEKLAFYVHKFRTGEWMPTDPVMYRALLQTTSVVENELSLIKSFDSKRWYDAVRMEYINTIPSLWNQFLDDETPRLGPRPTLRWFESGLHSVSSSFRKLEIELTPVISACPLEFLRRLRALCPQSVTVISMFPVEKYQLAAHEIRADAVGNPVYYRNNRPILLDSHGTQYFQAFRETVKACQEVVLSLYEDSLLDKCTTFGALHGIKQLFLAELWLPPAKAVKGPNGLGYKYQSTLRSVCRNLPAFKPVIKGNSSTIRFPSPLLTLERKTS